MSENVSEIASYQGAALLLLCYNILFITIHPKSSKGNAARPDEGFYLFKNQMYMQDNQTVNGHWVYGAIVIPVKEIYIGMSGQKYTSQRWRPSVYKQTALQPYIEQYGWNNIHFFVFKDGLTKKQAEQLEDLLITQAKLDNWCINKQGSGGEWRDNPSEYEKKRYQDNREEKLLYRRQYYKEHKEEKKQYREAHKEEKKQYDKQLYSMPEGKIYHRVKAYNRRHPDQIKETPMEAKNKYLEYGYLPSYVKNTDLK